MKYENVIKYFNSIINMRVSKIQLGHGSFITIDFGELLKENLRVRGNIEEKFYGEYHLWIYQCVWRIVQKNVCLAASEDKRKIIQDSLNPINGLKLISYDIDSVSTDLILKFENDILIKTFSIFTTEMEHWLLYIKNEKVLIAGPGNSFTYKNAN
jgi:hypothetical protein